LDASGLRPDRAIRLYLFCLRQKGYRFYPLRRFAFSADNDGKSMCRERYGIIFLYLKASPARTAFYPPKFSVVLQL
jgi:hypothetical protein